MKRIFYADQIRVSRILQHLYEMATANGYETRYTSADSINHYATTIRNGNRHGEKDQSKKYPQPVGCRYANARFRRRFELMALPL